MKLTQAYRHAWKVLDDDGNEVMDNGKVKMDSEYRTEPMTIKAKGDNLHAGDLVHSVISAGGGRYYVTRMGADDDFALTDDQVRQVRHEAWKYAVSDTKRDGSIHGGKLRKVAEGIDSIIQAFQNNSSKKYGVCCTQDEADAIMAILTKRLTKLENTLYGGGADAGEVFEI